MARVVVLGGGESGTGSAVLAKQKGFDTFLSDKGRIAEGYSKILTEHGIPYEEGRHTEGEILSADTVIKSPGIPDSSPIVARIREAGIPVISEIEFAGRYTSAKTICITGSNGKTTTTTLIYNILKQAGYNVGLAGNIGDSFAMSVSRDSYDWYVLELSSFQLDGMYDFRADTAVLTNITPDHLDRYGYDLQKYADSKFRVIRNQRPEDTFIFCQDDPVTMENIGRYSLTMKTRPFSAYCDSSGEGLCAAAGTEGSSGAAGRGDSDRAGTCNASGRGDSRGMSSHGVSGRESSDRGASSQAAAVAAAARIVDGVIEVDSGGSHVSIPLGELKIKGIHNSYNVMAAALAALSAGVEPGAIYDAAVSFAGVEHRLEPAGCVAGVLYINDSKATNVDSAWYALESMDRPVVWIAGGTDKGNDYTKLYDLAEAKVKALVCMGVDNGKLVTAFTDRVPKVADTHSLDEAMNAASGEASEGDVVLLSPACASFDLFRNYEDRGRRFKQWIAEKDMQASGEKPAHGKNHASGKKRGGTDGK